MAKGDQLVVEDCHAPSTSKAQLTPCRTVITSNSKFFPATFANAFGSSSHQLSDGSITSVAGIAAWMAMLPDVGSAAGAYRAVHLNVGSAYTGLPVRDATLQRIFSLGSQTPQGFSIVLNSATVASVSTALNF